MTSVVGISTAIATGLIEVTGGFRHFHSAKALSKFIGVAPIIYQSGKLNSVKGICKTGDGQLRSMLYVASWSAIQHNKSCRELYHRLKAAGKALKVALIAVVNKLLRQAFAVVKFDQNFDPNYKPVFCLSLTFNTVHNLYFPIIQTSPTLVSQYRCSCHG